MIRSINNRKNPIKFVIDWSQLNSYKFLQLRLRNSSRKQKATISDINTYFTLIHPDIIPTTSNPNSSPSQKNQQNFSPALQIKNVTFDDNPIQASSYPDNYHPHAFYSSYIPSIAYRSNKSTYDRRKRKV